MPFGSRPLLSRGEESFHFHAASLNIPFFNAYPRLNILWGFFKGDIQGIPDEPSLEKVSPPSSILHSLPPFSSLLRNSCFVSRNEGTKERKREGGRRLGERFGNLSSPPPLYRLTRPMIIIELSAVSTSSRSHGQAAPRTNAVRHLSGLEYPPFPPPPPLDNAHTRSITTLLL